MHIFRRPDYRSHTTQFLEQLHNSDPNLRQRQQNGHTQTWTDNTPPTSQATSQDATDTPDAYTIKQSGYVYLTQPFTNP